MKYKKNIFMVCILLLFFWVCIWSAKSLEAERINNRKLQQMYYENIHDESKSAFVNKETTSEMTENRETYLGDAEEEDNSFSDVEYGKYSKDTPKLIDFIMESDSFTLCFKDNFQVLVSYDEKQGRLQLHLPGCRPMDFELPGFYKNEYFEELIIAGSEDGIDVIAYVGNKWKSRIIFEFEESREKGYNSFATDIIVPE